MLIKTALQGAIGLPNNYILLSKVLSQPSSNTLPVLGISVTCMKMESLNSPNLVKACILQRI